MSVGCEPEAYEGAHEGARDEWELEGINGVSNGCELRVWGGARGGCELEARETCDTCKLEVRGGGCEPEAAREEVCNAIEVAARDVV